MKNYSLIIGSPVEYNELVVYIKIYEEYIALIHRNEGDDKIKIVFIGEHKEADIYLDSFFTALYEAKKVLLS